MKGEEWGEMRGKQEEEKGRGKERRGEKTGEMKEKKRRGPFLTRNNDTTIGLCFLFSAD